MGGKEVVVIEISPDPSKKKMKAGDADVDEETPLRPILCLKTKLDMRRFEETEDCFILDLDPFDSIDIQKLTVSDNHVDDHEDDENDLSIIAEKGQVACRDYPHPRHLCLKFPFGKTPHESHCHLCYCYVCDLAAPCRDWTLHCDASTYAEDWKLLRDRSKKRATATFI